MSPGEFVHGIRQLDEQEKARLIVIDSLNSYLNAMPAEKYLHLQLHELFTYLNQRGVVTIATLAQQGLVGLMQNQVDLSYLADTVLLFRYFEARGELRQAFSVVKKRSGAHERSIREFRITSEGLKVGQPLRDFDGVLTGVPRYNDKNKALIDNQK
jgi:circadian clock protein KaiC